MVQFFLAAVLKSVSGIPDLHEFEEVIWEAPVSGELGNPTSWNYLIVEALLTWG